MGPRHGTRPEELNAPRERCARTRLPLADGTASPPVSHSQSTRTYLSHQRGPKSGRAQQHATAAEPRAPQPDTLHPHSPGSPQLWPQAWPEHEQHHNRRPCHHAGFAAHRIRSFATLHTRATRTPPIRPSSSLWVFPHDLDPYAREAPPADHATEPTPPTGEPEILYPRRRHAIAATPCLRVGRDGASNSRHTVPQPWPTSPQPTSSTLGTQAQRCQPQRLGHDVPQFARAIPCSG